MLICAGAEEAEPVSVALSALMHDARNFHFADTRRYLR